MTSSPPFFPGDFDGTSSSDMPSISSHPPNQNAGFAYPSDIGLSAKSSAHNFGGNFPSPGFNPTRPQPVFSNSSVRILAVPIPSVLYIVQQHAMAQASPPFPHKTTYNYAPPRMNGPFEELQRLRSERDRWRIMYFEQK